MEPREDHDDDALGQAPDAHVTGEELPARRRLWHGWAVIAGTLAASVAVVLLIAWAVQ
jgi:hypothetical protein